MRAPRFPTRVQGKIQEFQLMHASLLCPAETLKMTKFEGRLQSAPCVYSLVPMVFDMFFFLVPIRAVWSDWDKYIMDQGGSPTGGSANEALFMRGTVPHNFIPKAYESIVERFFRDEDDTEAVAHPAMAAIPDLTGEFRSDKDEDGMDETINTADGLTVREIDRARARVDHQIMFDRMSGHYEDYLKAQGQRVDPKIILEPELVGNYRKFLYPSKTVSQTDGSTVQSIFHDFAMRLNKPRRSYEHSMLIGIMSLRPKIVHASPTQFGWINSPERWPAVTQLPEHRKFVGDPDEFNSGARQMNMDQLLKYGTHMCGDHANFKFCGSGPMSSDTRYPTAAEAASYIVDSGTGETYEHTHYMLDGAARTEIVTPLELDVL